VQSLRAIYCCLLLLSTAACAQPSNPYILVLGTAQDGGYPHMGCQKACCNKAWKDNTMRRNIVSLALVDPRGKKWWLFEATPDIKEQLHLFQQITKEEYHYLPDGIFITHAHIGHYTGLMQFGKEAMNTNSLPVYVLPKMKKFLETNGPWSQLVQLNNIHIIVLDTANALTLTSNITVTTFTVPHRDEYSETAGFSINTGYEKYLFIPDINKWQWWKNKITEEVKQVTIAFLDGTFYDSTELPGRRMNEVPHPFITETMNLFAKEDDSTKAKIRFIHFNHTNPVLWDSTAQNTIVKNRYRYAAQGLFY
jgi:pyrroloquinoline quinone biosynthesis protein B